MLQSGKGADHHIFPRRKPHVSDLCDSGGLLRLRPSSSRAWSTRPGVPRTAMRRWARSGLRSTRAHVLRLLIEDRRGVTGAARLPGST